MIDLMYCDEDSDIEIMRFLYEHLCPETGKFIWMHEKLDSLRPILRKDIALATKLFSAMEKIPRDYYKVPPGIDLEANDEVR